MNYKAFFADKKTVQGQNFSCSYNFIGGDTAFTGDDEYPVLFVLAGSLTLFCDGSAYLFPAGEMAIVNRKCFTYGCCIPQTIVMEYRLPGALTAHFNAFKAPATRAIPISGRLETWVEQRLLGQFSPTTAEDEELIDMLVRYQSRRLKSISEPMKCYIEEKNGPRRRKPHPENKKKECDELPELI